MEVSECEVGRRFVPEEFKVERVVAETQGDDDGAFPGKSPRGARLRDGGRGRRAAGVGVYIMLSMLKTNFDARWDAGKRDRGRSG